LNSHLSLIGVEDGWFKPHSPNDKTVLCCVNIVGKKIYEVKTRWIQVDGTDATMMLLEMLVNVQFDAIILGGISYAGFNIIDALTLNNAVHKPVIVYIPKKPGSVAMRNALRKHFSDWENRWKLVEQLGEVYNVVIRSGQPEIFFEVIGANCKEAVDFLQYAAMTCRTPEPVRIAGLIARGLTRPY